MKTPWQPVPALEATAFRQVRRETIFQCFKWDVQVGDVCVLSPVPIVLRPEAWSEICGMAEHLAAETLAAEKELKSRPHLHARLGLPAPVLKELRRAASLEASATDLRVIRFDFHYTRQGWQISEANTDVPGGFNEASGLTRLVSQYYPGLSITGDPAKALAQAIRSYILKDGAAALVHATAYTDDRQVMAFLARELQSQDVEAQLVSPDHLAWREGQAFIRASWHNGPAGFVFRFFPAEWLVNLRRTCGWSYFFHGARTPLANPATVLLTQSKRFPLVWDEMKAPLPTWRKLMPETRPLETAPWQQDGEWVLKPALGRVGDRIGLRGITDARKWLEIYRSVRKEPQHWVAQRRFEAVPMDSEQGSLYPCVGVYVIDGRVCGAYGRVARVPLIDQYAQDAAVLLSEPLSGTPEPRKNG